MKHFIFLISSQRTFRNETQIYSSALKKNELFFKLIDILKNSRESLQNKCGNDTFLAPINEITTIYLI